MTHRIGRPPYPDVLTPAEWRVLDQVRSGHPNAEIAVRLGISINTVRYHVSNMLAKLELADRQALAAWDGQPKRRFGWLPTLPIALGSLSRSTAILGGGIAAAAVVVVVALTLATGDATEAARTSILLEERATEGSRLVGVDPTTGAPLAGGALRDVVLPTAFLGGDYSGLLDDQGSLIWFTANPRTAARRATSTPCGAPCNVITVIDGERIGLAPSEFPADRDGVVQRWTLPSPGDGVHAGLSPLVSTPDGRLAYGVRFRSEEPFSELWEFDITSDRLRLVTTAGAISGTLYVSASGRLFLLKSEARSAVSEIDPADGTEITRIEIGRAISHSTLVDHRRTLHLFHHSGARISTVDLETLTISAQRPLPDGITPPSERPWSAALSADGGRLYVAGHQFFDCNRPGLGCQSRLIGLHVVDLDTLEVIHADPEVGQLALSPDGRWLVTIRANLEDGAAPAVAGLTIVDTSNFRVVAHLERDTQFWSPTISAHGRYAYALSPGAGVPADPRERCATECTVVTVVDLERLEVIARHTYDEPGLVLTEVP